MDAFELEPETDRLVDDKFSIEIQKYNHIFCFLHICADKGQVGFVMSSVDSLNHHIYWDVVEEMYNSSIDFNSIQQLVETKIRKKVEQLTERYYERAVTIRDSKMQ